MNILRKIELQRPNISHIKVFGMTNLNYEFLKKSVKEPQYTTYLGMIFFGTDVMFVTSYKIHTLVPYPTPS